MLYFFLFLLTALSFLLWFLYFILVVITYKQTPKLSKTSSKKSLKNPPLISIIIPSRNEARKIGKCINSLKSQTYPKLEILIVDDSTDNTVEVIRNIVGDDKRFKILKQEKLLSGWVGKSHALQQGSTQANGEWLLFIDADTYYDAKLIERAIEYAIENKIDLLSLMPQQICESFWEKVIQPVILGLLILPLLGVNKPKSKIAMAFGYFMLLKHSVFNEVGGYETIKGKIVDDIEMAKLIKYSGFKISLVNAQRMMKIRMYGSFSEIWEGWSKNIVLGVIQNRRIRSKTLKALVVFLYLFCIFEAFVLPFLIVIISSLLNLSLLSRQWWYLLLFSSLTWLFTVLIQFYVSKRFYIGDPKYVPLTFLGGITIIGIILNSAIRVLSGRGVTWKGRTYRKKIS